MADTKISALTAVVTVAGTDEFATNQGAVSKRVTLAQIEAYLQSRGMSKTAFLSSDYTNATTTGTSVTGLAFTGLVAGTYRVQWTLFVASDTTTTSFKFGVNYTGTVTRMMNMAQFPSAGVTAATGTMIDVANAVTGQVLAYANSTTETTTAPNLGPWVGVTTINVFHRIMVESLVVVSDSGDLELWAGAEVATTITIKAGSMGVLHRVN